VYTQAVHGHVTDPC